MDGHQPHILPSLMRADVPLRRFVEPTGSMIAGVGCRSRSRAARE
ncbi:hypothetical protein NY08_330 [Rhodococcus sp. B7740]|nr:hypothetical protein NY08_330 [Rhodococcus sp. B7740]